MTRVTEKDFLHRDANPTLCLIGRVLCEIRDLLERRTQWMGMDPDSGLVMERPPAKVEGVKITEPWTPAHWTEYEKGIRRKARVETLREIAERAFRLVERYDKDQLEGRRTPTIGVGLAVFASDLHEDAYWMEREEGKDE